MSKKLFAQREKIIEEYKEKKREFAKHRESFNDDLTDIYDLLCAKIPKLKIKAVNILSELYPDIQFELKELLHQQFTLEVNLSNINKFLQDLTNENVNITPHYQDQNNLTINKILISYDNKRLLIITRSNSYTLNIAQDHKFYKLYRIMRKLNEISNAGIYDSDSE
jgi:hypothetical protein